MREAGRPGMSEEQVRDFCSRYMPAYRAYLPGLYDKSSGRAAEDGVVIESGPDDGGNSSRGNPSSAQETLEGNSMTDVEKTLVIEVGRDRNPVL